MWVEAIGAYVTYLRAAGQSTQTIRLRRHYLGRLAAAVGEPWAVETAELVAWVAGPEWKPETRKSARASVRGFYAWALAAGHVQRDPAAGLPRVRVPMGQPRPTPGDVIETALAAADERTRLMLLLALLAGLRRGEIAALHTDDIWADHLRITGKGGRTRCVPLHPRLAEALRGSVSGWVFPGRIDGHVSPGHVGKVLTRALGGGWTGHTVRHSAASTWYARSGDILAVRDLLGHASVVTTQRYTATPDDALRRAVGG